MVLATVIIAVLAISYAIIKLSLGLIEEIKTFAEKEND
jgi:hypothetical protein